MNLLGPLTNPAGGADAGDRRARPDLVDTFAQVAAALGTERTVVVHGAGGIDELSPARRVADGDRRGREHPQAAGRARGAGLREVRRRGAARRQRRRQRAPPSAPSTPARGARSATPSSLNAAAGLVACGRAGDMAAGVAEAAAALDAGTAEATLNHLIIRSRELAGLET